MTTHLDNEPAHTFVQYDPAMGRRILIAISVAVATSVALAGCSSTLSTNPARTAAQSDTQQWIKDAASAVATPPPSSEVKTSGYENCRSDHGYFVTKSEWRTVAQLTVPRASQSAAMKDIVASFAGRGWTSKTTAGILTLTGPKSARGLIRVESGGDASLDISAVSACYS